MLESIPGTYMSTSEKTPSRAYPYTAWTLTSGFTAREVEMVKPYRAYGHADYGDESAAGKIYRLCDLFASREAAVTEGWARVDKQVADQKKKSAVLQKKRDALNNSVGAMSPLRRMGPGSVEISAEELADLRLAAEHLAFLEAHPNRVNHAVGYHGGEDGWVYTSPEGHHHQAEGFRDAIRMAIVHNAADKPARRRA